MRWDSRALREGRRRGFPQSGFWLVFCVYLLSARAIHPTELVLVCHARHTRGTWRSLAVGEIGYVDGLRVRGERVGGAAADGGVSADERGVCGRWTRRAVPSAVRVGEPIAGDRTEGGGWWREAGRGSHV